MAEHVVFVVGVYPPMVGGIETHVSHLAAELVRLGHRVTVVTITGDPGTRDEDGIRVVRLPRRWDVAGIVAFPPFGTARRIARLARAEAATAISTHTRFFPMSFVGLRAARRSGVPLVHTEHSSDHVKGVSPMIGIASRIVDGTLGRRVLRGATKVLALSESVVAFVRRLAGVDGQIFLNAIDTDAWSRAAIDATTTTRPRPVVFVGRLVPGKGWDDFIAVVAELAGRADVPEFTAHVLGGGPDLGAARAAIDAADLGARLQLHGPVPPARVSELLAGGILVNPTRLSEGFQTTLLEALAVGAEIVSYPVPGLADLVSDGAPVREVQSGNRAALAGAVLDSLREPSPPFDRGALRAWSWPARAGEYADVVASLRQG